MPSVRTHTSSNGKNNNTGFYVWMNARQRQHHHLLYGCNASKCTNAVMAMRWISEQFFCVFLHENRRTKHRQLIPYLMSMYTVCVLMAFLYDVLCGTHENSRHNTVPQFHASFERSFIIWIRWKRKKNTSERKKNCRLFPPDYTYLFPIYFFERK